MRLLHSKLGRHLKDHRSREWARFGLGLVLPYSLVCLRNQRWHDRQRAASARRLSKRSAAQRAPGQQVFDYEDAVAFLVGRGLDELAVRAGSMPAASLRYSHELLERHLPTDRALVGLHVGNFVGISLASFSSLLSRRHTDSVVLSIDPQTSHRGIENPEVHVYALLGRVGLLDANLVIAGYTLEHALGELPERAGPDYARLWAVDVGSAARAPRSGFVLRNLAQVAPGRIDLAVIDGNHEGGYLQRELLELRRLLVPGALVVVDDVHPGVWNGVVDAFERTAQDPSGEFAELGRDGRVGVLKFRGS